ncbi:TetR/AcrR family transcriptional regulator [Pseudonocardia sp. CA-107938]|uniref:TetR/AcrR family transcriptional regulator n=1 Tax=Pseudonocardia sp. CA-107938 TaxID=3240021 RepID=UPI003D939BAC
MAVLPPVPLAPPPAALDPYLDATARCFVRYGVRRTSVPDVAQELGVNRTTVYRQVGTIEQAAMLLLIRDAHRLLTALPGWVDGPVGPGTVVDLVATVVRRAREHPVLAKVLADEPDLVGTYVTRDSAALIELVTGQLRPLLEEAAASGAIARRDPVILAEWLVRNTVSLILTPPPVELEQYLGEILLPALAP